MSINQQKLSLNPNLRNKKKKNRRKGRHQDKINKIKEQKIIKFNNDLNNNKYDTWKSETIKPVSNIRKNYYNYYKVIEELKKQQEDKLKLIMYIENSYEHINNNQIDELDEINKNTCLIC